MQDITIRRAQLTDTQALTDFNCLMAQETEHKQLDPAVVFAGVTSLLTHPQYGFYLVAEQNGEVVASLMITTEWSDWRNGVFWWIQSVYVREGWRRQGIYSRLYAEVKAQAARAETVCGFRLYVEKDNRVAQLTYQQLGMKETDYLLYEQPIQ